MVGTFTIGVIEREETVSVPQTPVISLLGSVVQGGTGVGAFTNPSDSIAVTNNEDSVYAVLTAFGTTGTGGGNPLTAALTYGGQALIQVASNQANLDATSPVVRLYRLESAPTGSNTFFASLASGQDVNSWGAAIFSVANDGGVGPNVLATIGDAASSSQNLTMTEVGSVAFGGWAVQGNDSLPFTEGSGYLERLESDTVSSGVGSDSADMGWMVQSSVSAMTGGKTFDAAWSTSDGFGVAGIEILKGGSGAPGGGGGGPTPTDQLGFPSGDELSFPSGDTLGFP